MNDILIIRSVRSTVKPEGGAIVDSETGFESSRVI